jgi:hypothetical protein
MPVKLSSLSVGYAVAFQLTCLNCGHLRFADAQTVYARATEHE